MTALPPEDEALWAQCRAPRDYVALATARLLRGWPASTLHWDDGLLIHIGADGVQRAFVCLDRKE